MTKKETPMTTDALARIQRKMKLSKMVAALILMVLLLAQLEPQTKTNKGKNKMAQHDDDNRSQQLNPEHDAYWQSRG